MYVHNIAKPFIHSSIYSAIHDQRLSIRTMCDMVPIHIHFDMLEENFAHICCATFNRFPQ